MEQLLLFPEVLQNGEYPLPATAVTKQCASCGANIVWIWTERGERMPLALDTARDCAGQRVAMNHFVDCPHGKDWSRK